MTKELNWDQIAKVNFDQNRRKATGQTTGKELFAKAFDSMKKAEAAINERKEAEPILKQELLKAMLTKSVITVRIPINNPTESLGGLTKSEEDDGFYNSSPSANLEAQAKLTFQEVMEVIPPGTELIFKSWDKQLRQWIFKGNNGQEYGIYTDSVIIFKERSIENPGMYGLLFNTSLIDSLGE